MSAVVRNFRDLQVWQKARVLVQIVYRTMGSFPKEEMYGLTSQMRRAAISVMSNIAEGSSKKSTREFIRFLNMSIGSLAELSSQLTVAMDLEYISDEQNLALDNTILELGRMLQSLHISLNKRLETTDA